MDWWISAAPAVMQTLYWPVVVKRELGHKTRLSVYQSIFIPNLTYFKNCGL